MAATDRNLTVDSKGARLRLLIAGASALAEILVIDHIERPSATDLRRFRVRSMTNRASRVYLEMNVGLPIVDQPGLEDSFDASCTSNGAFACSSVPLEYLVIDSAEQMAAQSGGS